MLIQYNGKKYYDLTLFIMDNPLPEINLVQVKSTGKNYLVIGDEPLVTDYVVDYSKLKAWNVAALYSIIKEKYGDIISVDMYHEYEIAFNNVSTNITRILDDVKPQEGPNEN